MGTRGTGYEVHRRHCFPTPNPSPIEREALKRWEAPPPSPLLSAITGAGTMAGTGAPRATREGNTYHHYRKPMPTGSTDPINGIRPGWRFGFSVATENLPSPKNPRTGQRKIPLRRK
ncbi:hypothetical protein ACQJBY_025126 [Aegilops geniculata]